MFIEKKILPALKHEALKRGISLQTLCTRALYDFLEKSKKEDAQKEFQLLFGQPTKTDKIHKLYDLLSTF